MSGQQPRYYRPYDSGDESDQESVASTGTTDSWFNTGIDNVQQLAPDFENNMPDFKQFATQLQLQRAGGPPISTLQQDLELGQDLIGRKTTYSLFEPLPPGYKADYLPFQSGNGTTIILIDSRHRDRQVYPQPTNFTLRMPKIFKQVNLVNFAQIKLLTSFYYFRLSKYNTDISIHEQGRQSLYNGILQSTIVKSFIRTGSYNIDQLQQELQIQLNYTPLFFDFINGFNDFVAQFRSTGDFGLNFNEPGDYFYNNTTNQFEANPTKTSITQHFWKNRYGGQTVYTNTQCRIAYYYPVLNEALLDEQYPVDFINLTPGIGVYPSLTTTAEVKNWLLYQFTGINDPVALAVINANLVHLDQYRLEHTFRYWLINKYVVSRNPQSQIVYITTPSLNTSLVNLLNLVQERALRRALALNGLTTAQYSNLIVSVDKARAVLNGMYGYEQTQFLTYFGVPWSQYTLSYYANLSNSIYVQYGIGLSGVPANDGEAIDAGVISYNTDILTTLASQPNVYWPNLQSTTDITIGYVNLSTATSSFQYVYTPSISNIDTRHTIIQPNKDNTIYINYLNNAGNAICPIEPGKYTIFKFNSPVRQTMQVETLMRPTPYRLPKYNQSNFGSSINTYFDLSYSFVFTSNTPYPPNQSSIYTMAYDNLPASNLYTIDGWGASNVSSTNTDYSWNRSFASSQAAFKSTINLTVQNDNRALYFQFVTPYVSTPQITTVSPNSNYTYRLNLNVGSYCNYTSFTRVNVQQTVRMFLYHDRGAFQADAGCNRNENPVFFKYSTILQVGSNLASISFTTYENQTYYVILRPDDSNFASIFARVFPSFATSTIVTTQTRSVQGINPATDITSPSFSNLVRSNFNYAQVYDSNWIQLPIGSNLYQAEPKASAVEATYPLFLTPIGYDENDVSSDFTDYIPYTFNSITGSFTPNCNVGIDPINQYLFQSNSPYSTTYNAYFYLDSLNSIFTPAFDTVYYNSLVDKRQLKLIHYYSLNYMPQSDCNASFPAGLISKNSAQQPYTISTTQNVAIAGYQYGTSCNIQMQKGVMGFSFIPTQGVWDVKRIMFRSAIDDSNLDPNQYIKYLAVYTYGDILSTTTKNMTLSTALVVLSNSSRVTYNSTLTVEQNGFDTKGGTYYEFIKDTSFGSYCNQPILGYDQSPGTMSDQPESMYMCVPFSQFNTPMTIKALSGSAIPYPLYNQVLVSTCYLDGTHAYNSTFNVVVPGNVGQSNWPWATSQSTLYAPQNGFDKTQAQYSLSLPIGTSVLSTKLGIDLDQDTQFLRRWNTSSPPLQIVATASNSVLVQDTQYSVYIYDPLDINPSFTNADYTFTADDIYPSYTNISLVAISGTSTHYYFLGFLDNGTNFQLRLRRFDPTNGTIDNYTLDSTYVVPKNGTVQSFTINDFGQLVLTYRVLPGTTYIYYNTTTGGSMTSYTVTGSSNAIHATDPTFSTIFWLPLDASLNTATTVRRWFLGAGNPVSGTSFTTTGTGIPSSWTNIAVQNAAYIAQSFNRIFLTNQQGIYSSNIYYSKSVNFGTNVYTIAPLATQLSNSDGTVFPVANMVTGYNASFWATGINAPFLWGNRNSDTDVTGIVDSAWQIFYPFQKIVLEKLSNAYNDIFDSNFVNYPEYPHTNMFFYRTETAMNRDIRYKWGAESSNNFISADPNFSGYYFNSYVYACPLVRSSNANFQCLAVRGFSPTEKSETLIRFVLPNKYDFGYVTSYDLIYEISTLQITPGLYTTNYAYILSNFDIAFQQSNSFFGQELVPNFEGSNINSSNFAEFAYQFSSIYGNYLSNQNLLDRINNFVQSNVLYFISTQMYNYIPPQAINRQNFTAPIPFSILWNTGLLPQYKNLLEFWGLGYNLGYAKLDTPYSTYAPAVSFYKILDDYIYLRLNPEYNMNILGTTSNENFNITRDSTGQINNYYGKLLLANFGEYSQTMMQNQAEFNPPIGRIDQFSFQWTNEVGETIDNFDCEWTATLAITENVQNQLIKLPPLPPVAGGRSIQ